MGQENFASIPENGFFIPFENGRQIKQEPGFPGEHYKQRYVPGHGPQQIEREITTVEGELHRVAITYSLDASLDSPEKKFLDYVLYIGGASQEGAELTSALNIYNPYANKNKDPIASIIQEDGHIEGGFSPEPQSVATIEETFDTVEALQTAVRSGIEEILDNNILIQKIRSGQYIKPNHYLEVDIDALPQDVQEEMQRFIKDRVRELYPNEDDVDSTILLAKRIEVGSLLMSIGAKEVFVRVLHNRVLSGGNLEIDEKFLKEFYKDLLFDINIAKESIIKPGIGVRFEDRVGILPDSPDDEEGEDEDQIFEPKEYVDYGAPIQVPGTPYYYIFDKNGNTYSATLLKGEARTTIYTVMWNMPTDTMQASIADPRSDFAAVLDTIPVTFSSPQGTVSTSLLEK